MVLIYLGVYIYLFIISFSTFKFSCKFIIIKDFKSDLLIIFFFQKFKIAIKLQYDFKIGKYFKNGKITFRKP